MKGLLKAILNNSTNNGMSKNILKKENKNKT